MPTSTCLPNPYRISKPDLSLFLQVVHIYCIACIFLSVCLFVSANLYIYIYIYIYIYCLFISFFFMKLIFDVYTDMNYVQRFRLLFGYYHVTLTQGLVLLLLLRIASIIITPMISHCTNGDMSKHLLFMKFLAKLSFIIIFYQCYLYMSIIIIIFIIIVLAFWPLIFTLLLLLWILFMLTLMGVYIMLYHLSYYIKKMIKGK